MSDSCTLGVLLPIRAPAPWLNETLIGLREQTFTRWRLIAAIHGEDEQISNLVRSVFPDAIIVVVGDDVGLSEVLNAGLSACDYEFIARIDSDDIPLAVRFERQIQFLLGNPEMLVVGSAVSLIDEDSQTLGHIVGSQSQRHLMSGLKWKNLLAHPSVMYRRAEVLAAGGYDALATHVEDYCLWLTLGASGELASLAEPLTQYRIHPNQVSRTKFINSVARQRVLQARIAYARGRHQSLLIARIRHLVWSSRQVLRELGKRTH